MHDILVSALREILAELGAPEAVFTVEHPSDLAHGDFATNAALAAAKSLGQNPRELATEIAEKLRCRGIEAVSSVSVAGPGFINITLEPYFYSRAVAAILKEKEAWGHTAMNAGERIMFEYTSPNLFKPLHIGNLVGNIVGESLTRLLEASGAKVIRMNYPSDIGLTVAKGVWGLKKTGADPDDISALGEAYRAGNEAYETNETAKAEIEAVNRALYADSDTELSALRAKGVATSHRHLMELCRMLGTTFDAEIRESEAGPVGQEIVRAHMADGIFEESDGAVIYKGEKVGLHTRVFLNSQGLPTYEAKDVGNFFLKQKAHPDWTQAFIVTGGEQREYFKVVFAALREVFTEAKDKILVHIPTGFLTLTTGKMSSRKGNVLTGESLIEEMREHAAERAKETRASDLDTLTEEIAVAALKFQILRQAVGGDIVFDKERALSFEGESGPYLQYTAVRARSILAKAQEAGIEPNVTTGAPEAPYAIERIIYRYPEAVARATADRSPHHVAQFLTELAGAYNSFYATYRIVDTVDPAAPYKVAITEAVAITIENGLYLLGIKTPKEM